MFKIQDICEHVTENKMMGKGYKPAHIDVYDKIVAHCSTCFNVFAYKMLVISKTV